MECRCGILQGIDFNGDELLVAIALWRVERASDRRRLELPA